MSAFRRACVTVASGALAVTCGVAFADTNTAFVFVKPHANTPAAQALVKKTLAAKNITIKAEGDITAEQIE